ncbi:hypothetical protein TNCV_662391 [Trichonephila clavipes]|nr:hypothetical protein TNCV_662391 [Trichonephila clavipes]
MTTPGCQLKSTLTKNAVRKFNGFQVACPYVEGNPESGWIENFFPRSGGHERKDQNNWHSGKKYPTYTIADILEFIQPVVHMRRDSFPQQAAGDLSKERSNLAPSTSESMDRCLKIPSNLDTTQIYKPAK